MRPPRTHHHRDFPLHTLLAAKAAAGASVAVVIPAKDEQRHVGRVVATLLEQAVRPGLVDDLLVVDGASRDATAAVAAAAGARVVAQDDVLPEAGPGTGKGEALWKGLAATDADLVCFVDADIVDIDARFVTGLLGPLLTDPSIQFAKATYDRPLDLGEVVLPAGGGRVTELLARPLINAFWPELAWLAQPLSGEYAGRRSLLEALPFVSGYGVELAMLVDIAHGFGAQVIAQVDLDRRQHEHQDLAALGRMAAQILAVALDRLAEQDRAVLTDAPNTTFLQPLRAAAGLALTESSVSSSQRPPLRDWRVNSAS